MDNIDKIKVAATVGGSSFGTFLQWLGFDGASEFSWTMAGTLSFVLILGWIWDRGKEAFKVWRVWRALERRKQLRVDRKNESTPMPL